MANQTFAKTRLFQEKHLPLDSTLVGTAALVHHLDVAAPVRLPCCVSEKRFKESIRAIDTWRVFDNKYAVEDSLQGHLTFAIRHEPFDLLVLKRIFKALPQSEVIDLISGAPTGPVSRRVWFLYEFLTGTTLPIPDCGKVSAVDLLDPKQYFVRDGVLSARHKVRNNLLGSARFCPMIRRSKQLETYLASDLHAATQSILARVSPQLIARAASFLLLADSQASFAIEGERLPRSKETRWVRAVQQVGRHPLSVDELNRLHDILIEDHRFIKHGFRTNGVFLGQRTQDGTPLPEFIGARPDDLVELVTAMIEANESLNSSSLDAVLQATATAFGFVFIHPYEDGNGRLHRCIVHHVLAEKRFSPPGLVFPVSSIMLKWIDNYRQTLQNHSAPLMQFIEWTANDRGNVEVTNDTIDLYRYFDCTEAAEFLYRCVQETVRKDVPMELEYLQRHDRAMNNIMNILEMPDRLAEDFIMFMRQNDWKLPKRRRDAEFKELTDKEVDSLESVVRDAFDGYDS